jgi:site-specific DNA-methyltransferase (adenine-specific)
MRKENHNDRIVSLPGHHNAPAGQSRMCVVFGDCRRILSLLRENFNKRFRMVITSPPYWNLRDNKDSRQIGLEPTLDDYINELVRAFSLVRDLLAKDGSLFVNIGDMYEKGDLCLLPTRFAIAMKAAGWKLRNDIIWHKPNAMPMSVKNRLKNTYEHLLHFVSDDKYFYNLDAIREPHTSKGTTGWEKQKAKRGGNQQPNGRSHFRMGKEVPFDQYFHPLGKNPGDLWSIKTKPFPAAHHSVYPEELCTPPILATTEPADWVLDPFCGSGTTLLVAALNGRNAVGIELNMKDYRLVIEKRLAPANNMFSRIEWYENPDSWA